MKDDDLVSFLKKGKGGEEREVTLNPSPSSSPPIIIRKIFTMTTIKVYPGGHVFHQSTSGWIDKEGYVHKNTAKKKPKIIEPTKLKKLESW